MIEKTLRERHDVMRNELYRPHRRLNLARDAFAVICSALP
jgi:hypothetical protein